MEQQKTKKIDLQTLMFGKVPPHSKEIEEAVLGSMLLDDKLIIEVKAILQPNDFYIEANRIVCESIFKLAETSKPDIILTLEFINKLGLLQQIGGAYYLTQLTLKITSTVNIKQYCYSIKEKSIQRRLVHFSSEIINNAWNETQDVFELLSQSEQILKGINHEMEEMKIIPIANEAMQVVEQINDKVYKARNNIHDENLIYTGIREWDEVNGSLFPGVYVVAGRPGMGKGIHMTELICRMGKMYDIGVVNGEMTTQQLLKRVGCNLLGIDNFIYKKNPKFVTDEELQQITEAMDAAINLKLHIESSKEIDKIENKIKLWKDKHNVKVILADFLTLFKIPKHLEKYYNTSTQKVDYVLNSFVDIAKNLNIPIILYAQMNRQILGRHGNKEPNLSDLKQSGSIEELAYQVSFLHRPEYYEDKVAVDENGEDIKGLMYQIIAKHREGLMPKIKYRVDLAKSQVKSWDEDFRGFSKTEIDIPF